MNLYEIDQAILDCVDMETGEIVDIEMLEALELARDTKIENIALWIKNLNAEAKAVKEEKDKLANRQKVAENKAENLKKYLSNYLQGVKFKTPRVSISYKKSEKVIIEDINKLDKEFLSFKEPEPSKTKIKEAIKSGQEVIGAHLENGQNLIIK